MALAVRRSPRFISGIPGIVSDTNTVSLNIKESIVSSNAKKITSNKRSKKQIKTSVAPSGATTAVASISTLCRSKELKLQKNYEFVIGIDEAGRGPLAGPVVAAACLIPCGINIPGIADSKSITEEMRNEAYHHLTTNPQVIYHVVRIEHDEIDSINILQASLKAMRLAAEGVLQKVEKSYLTNSIALIDGPKIPQGMPIESLPVIKGDSFIFSIAAASILAKVTRDSIMNQYHELYPEYNFQQHKGYPTFAHRTVLTTAGPSPIHRLTYAPVKAVISVKNKYELCIPSDLFNKEKTNKVKETGKGATAGKRQGKKRAFEGEVEESEIPKKKSLSSKKSRKTK